MKKLKYLPLLLALTLGAFWLVYATCHGNRVQVAIFNLPQDTYFASVVAESDKTLINLPWAIKYVGFVSTMHPVDSGWSYHDHGLAGQPPQVDWDAFVEWKTAERYGVVTLSNDGTWRVTWFGPKDLTFEGRNFILGGGKVAFDCSQGTTELLSEEQVRQLGLMKAEESRQRRAKER